MRLSLLIPLLAAVATAPLVSAGEAVCSGACPGTVCCGTSACDLAGFSDPERAKLAAAGTAADKSAEALKAKGALDAAHDRVGQARHRYAASKSEADLAAFHAELKSAKAAHQALRDARRDAMFKSDPAIAALVGRCESAKVAHAKTCGITKTSCEAAGASCPVTPAGKPVSSAAGADSPPVTPAKEVDALDIAATEDEEYTMSWADPDDEPAKSGDADDAERPRQPAEVPEPMDADELPEPA